MWLAGQRPPSALFAEDHEDEPFLLRKYYTRPKQKHLFCQVDTLQLESHTLSPPLLHHVLLVWLIRLAFPRPSIQTFLIKVCYSRQSPAPIHKLPQVAPATYWFVLSRPRGKLCLGVDVDKPRDSLVSLVPTDPRGHFQNISWGLRRKESPPAKI